MRQHTQLVVDWHCMKVRSLFPGSCPPLLVFLFDNSGLCVLFFFLFFSRRLPSWRHCERGEPTPLPLPGQRQVVPVVLQGFAVLLEVEVGVAQLAVDGAERLQVFRAHLDGGLKERCPSLEVPGFAQSLAFQRQLQAGGLHPGEDETGTSESPQPPAAKPQPPKSKGSVICLLSVYQQPRRLRVMQPLIQCASHHGNYRVTGVTLRKLKKKAALALQ